MQPSSKGACYKCKKVCEDRIFKCHLCLTELNGTCRTCDLQDIRECKLNYNSCKMPDGDLLLLEVVVPNEE